jgi:hypothetical protein
MITKDATKAELIAIIKKRMHKVKPSQAAPFSRSLKYKKKSELKRIATRVKVKVDKTGYDLTYH